MNAAATKLMRIQNAALISLHASTPIHTASDQNDILSAKRLKILFTELCGLRLKVNIAKPILTAAAKMSMMVLLFKINPRYSGWCIVQV